VINKIRNCKEVNSFAQKLGEIILDNKNFILDRIRIIIENRNKLEKILSENGIEFIKSESNFVLIKVNDSDLILNKLKLDNVLVRDRSMFDGFENTIRVTIGEWEDMEKIINILLKNNEY
jgi:histidinol-phosphate aminotransferase